MKNRVILFLISLSILIPLKSKGMESSARMISTTIGMRTSVKTKTFINQKTGEKTYAVTYPIQEEGLIRLMDKVNFKNPDIYPGKLYPDNYKQIKVKILKKKTDQVIVSGTLDKKVVAFMDESNPNRQMRNEYDCNNELYIKSDCIWLPWWDDSIQDMSTYMKAERYDTLRGGNRLLLELREPGSYCITIPVDAEVEATLENGSVDYAFKEKSLIDFWKVERNRSNFNSQTSIESTDNGINYKTEYEFDKTTGLVRIKDCTNFKKHLYPENLKKINLHIFRDSHIIKVFAFLHKNVVDVIGKDKTQTAPWFDDLLGKENHTVRGQNRLFLELNEPGDYYITVPNDADVEAILDEGNIEYASAAPTMIRAQATDIEGVWQDGYSRDANFYWGSNEDPVTKLITKNGIVRAIRENRNNNAN